MLYVFARIASRTLPRIANFFLVVVASRCHSLLYEMMQIIASQLSCQQNHFVKVQTCRMRASATISQLRICLQFSSGWCLQRSCSRNWCHPFCRSSFPFKNIVALYTKRRELIIFQMTLCVCVYLGHFDCNHRTFWGFVHYGNSGDDDNDDNGVNKVELVWRFSLCLLLLCHSENRFSATLSLLSLLIFFNWIDYWWTMLIYDSFSTAISATC